MKPIEKVALIGLGAIGTLQAVKCHEYDPGCLRVIVDKSRYERYINEGVIFNGKRYDFNYALPDKKAEKADLIIIATKSGGLSEAIDAVEGFVGDETVILALLNGITSEEIIARKYGWGKVLYSFFIGHGSTRCGREVSHDGIGTIVFGELENAVISDRVAAVRDFFTKIGIDYKIPEDMNFALWSKFMLNVGFNQASAVLLAPQRVFNDCDKAMAIACKLMKEVVALAKKVGVKNAEKMLESSMGVMRAMPLGVKSSMLQDVEANKQTEVDIFAGTVCELGQKHGVPTPYNEVFRDLLEAINQKNSMNR